MHRPEAMGRLRNFMFINISYPFKIRYELTIISISNSKICVLRYSLLAKKLLIWFWLLFWEQKPKTFRVQQRDALENFDWGPHNY